MQTWEIEPAMGRLKMIAAIAAAVAIGGTVATAIAWRAWSSDSEPARRTGLAPTSEQLRYRFALHNAAVPDPRVELDRTIREMSRRVDASAQPLDMTELASLYYRRGHVDGDLRDYAAAERLAKRSLAILPSPNGATLTLAKLASARHDFRESIRLARSFHGRGSGVPMVLATDYLALGELDAAGREVERAVARKPGSGTYLMRALVREAQGKDAQAEADFAAAVRVEEFGDVQGSARTRALWGRFLLRRGELDGARRVLDEALRIAPDHALARATLGQLLIRAGDFDAAAAELERAFSASRQVRYLIDQAVALELAGRDDDADSLRAQVETIVRGELEERGLGHRLDLVEVLVERGGPARLAEAVMLAREEITRRGSAVAHFQLARALARIGAFHEAQHHVDAALASGAREAEIYELASRLARRHGDAARADTYERRANQLDPADAGWRELGMP